MEKIIEKMYKNRFNYCHVLEVNDIYELKTNIECIYEDLKSQGLYGEKFKDEEIKEFINTLEIYCLDEDQEDEVYNFDINNYLNNL